MDEMAAIKVDDEEMSKSKMFNSIVYTTRLDEMKIFSQVRSTKDTNAVFEAIIEESKPIINRKRVRSNSVDANERISAYEDLSLRINFINKKARVNRHNKNLLRLCKPVRVVVEKLKINSNKNIRENLKMNLKKDIRENINYLKLIPFFRMNTRHKINILYDQQNNEIDIYFLDSLLFMKEYVRLQDIQSYKSVLKELARSNENILTRNFCCWYARKCWLDKCHVHLGSRSLDSLNFMRKQHTCSINNCLCCCSSKLVLSNENYTKNKINRLEKPHDWFNKMTERTDLMNTPIVKSFNNNNTSLRTSNINCKIKNELSSLNSESINVNSKNQPPPTLLKNLCCWYKQEEIAARFLGDGGFEGKINFMRRPHLCSIMNCRCCCKPKKTQMYKLSYFDIPVRHTNHFTKYTDVKYLNDPTKFLNLCETKSVYASRPSSVDKSRPESVDASRLNPIDASISLYVSRPNPVNESRPNIVNVNRPNIINVNRPNIVNVNRPNIINVNRPNIVIDNRPNIVNVNIPNLVNVDIPNLVNVDTSDIINVNSPNIVNDDRPNIVNVNTSNIVNVNVPNLVNESNSKHETNSNKKNDIRLITFSISLLAFQNILQYKKEAPIEDISNFIIKTERPNNQHKRDKFVTFIINTAHAPYTVAIEKINMDSLTTKELLIIDMMFSAIETFSKQLSAKLEAQTSFLFCTKEMQTPRTHNEEKDMLSINEELRATAYLRSCQFGVCLEDHLQNLRLPKNQQLDYLNVANDPYKPVYRTMKQ